MGENLCHLINWKKVNIQNIQRAKKFKHQFSTNSSPTTRSSC
jgi:DNA replication protein DnaD